MVTMQESKMPSGAPIRDRRATPPEIARSLAFYACSMAIP
jgi:hypothetical protein